MACLLLDAGLPEDRVIMRLAYIAVVIGGHDTVKAFGVSRLQRTITHSRILRHACEITHIRLPHRRILIGDATFSKDEDDGSYTTFSYPVK
jgi:hypothetical protein